MRFVAWPTNKVFIEQMPTYERNVHRKNQTSILTSGRVNRLFPPGRKKTVSSGKYGTAAAAASAEVAAARKRGPPNSTQSTMECVSISINKDDNIHK